MVRGGCGWCGSKMAKLIPLVELAPMFRGAARMYTPNDGAYSLFDGRGEVIGELFQDDWQTFSERVVDRGLVQELAPG